MSKQNNGGLAFPEIKTYHRIDEGFAETYSEGGISVRDYFAAKAMQCIAQRYSSLVGYAFENIAVDSYKIADAMLKESEK